MTDEDPLSLSSLARRVGELELAIAAVTHLRRSARSPDSTTEPSWRTVQEALESHVQELADALRMAGERPPTLSARIAWHRAWKLYRRAYAALHDREPPLGAFRPPPTPPHDEIA